MKLVAALACRVNSKRLYAKPLQLLGESSILELIIEKLRKCPLIDEIVLAISDRDENNIFEDIAKKLDIPFVRGSDQDVLKRLIDACELVDGDQVFRVTTESPFFYLEGLESAVKSHNALRADYSTYGKLPDGSSFEIISLTALKKSHEEGEDRHRSELCTLYMNENPDKFSFNILTPPLEVQRPDYRLTIDYPEDLILCRKVYALLDGEVNQLSNIIKLLDNNKQLVESVSNLTDDAYIKFYH